MRNLYRLGLAAGALTFTAGVVLAGPASAGDNAFPVANDDYYTTTVDTPLDVPAPGFLGNDYDPEGVALHSTYLTPITPGGTATYGWNGDFHFTPDAGFAGDVMFRYAANDGWDSSVAIIHVTVEKPNQAPVANDDQYEAVAGQTLRIPAAGVLGNDYDPEGGPLSAMLESCSGLQHLTVGIDGSLEYTPTADTVGAVHCRYIAIDETGLATPAGITFKVRPADKPEPKKPDTPKTPKAPARPDAPKVTG